MAKDITKKNRRRVRKFKKRYAQIIDSTIGKMGNATMPELWVELDRIKQDMADEIQARGLML